MLHLHMEYRCYTHKVIIDKVRNNIGCVSGDSINIGKKSCLQGCVVPNAFSPNHDGKNDLLRPIIMYQLDKYTFVVFDRCGNIVFS
jgi:hypothetical protein